MIQSLRELSERHDGRSLKLLGDGCLAAFEDPRSAVAFAAEVPASCRVGLALGLIDVVEGELVGRPVYEAVTLMRSAGAGEVRCSPVVETICSPSDA